MSEDLSHPGTAPVLAHLQAGSVRPRVARLLLSSSALVALGTLAVSALADTNCTSNDACNLYSRGADGSPAPGEGQKGGDGQADPGWTWEVDNVTYVESGGTSPLNVSTNGGDGARGADGHTKAHDGGDGGKGGDGGQIMIITGTNTVGTTNGVASGITLNTTGGQGGGGAYGYLFDGAQPGKSGVGGNGGTITATIGGKWPAPTNTASGRIMDIWSLGGAGGDGRGWSTGQSTVAPNGGTGGNGQEIDVTLNTVSFSRSGVRIQSVGGQGGTGGDDSGADGAQGGNGGQAGNGGPVNVTVNNGTSLTQEQDQDAALWVVSSGGTGGQGGSGGAGGSGGTGGDAQDVTVTVNGGVFNAGGVTGSPAILAQTLGGNGGNGASPSHFVIGPQGGSGANGGHPGNVTITGGNANIKSGNWNVTDPTKANMAPAVLAQSIGGGGGGGGNSQGWFAVGGAGGNAIAAGNVGVHLSNSIITAYSSNSQGIAAQSIGGGGGKGGDAQGSGTLVNMVIGGTGGAGGAGGNVYVFSDGNAIETTNSHSHGVLAQSVGGGGGMGGAAYSKAKSAAFGASMSLGGTGGNGGDGGNVLLLTDASNNPLPTNSGRIRTFGSDSHGILVQSIGGGGGVGGASTASSQVYGGGDVPSIALAMAIGGNGGQGGSANTANALNTGLVQTAGAGAVGLMGQAIGGGGGTGGDASSSATASGLNSDTQSDYAFAADFAFGGKGGLAGNGGTVHLDNQGFILTTGESADGMLAQSIGGGGGAGGAGDAKAKASGGKDLSITASFGGDGAYGGTGQLASAINESTIITLGDGASGVVSQSIGGGGGRGGGAAASTSGNYTAQLTMGGAGKQGGSSVLYNGSNEQIPVAVVTNAAKATIATFGADANGMVVQSIGGGGGMGGKAGTSLGTKTSSGDGGSGDSATVQSAMNGIDSQVSQNGMSWLNQYAGVGGALKLIAQLLPGDGLALSDDDPEGALDDMTQSKGENDDDTDSESIAIAVALGGSAGAGGSAGYVTADNQGAIATMGHHADGILAQSIGGGGGKAGAASTAASNKYNGAIAVGGTGGDGGYSGTVQVTHSGTIYTMGALASGIVAQSVSGGGGVGGASASSVSASSKNGLTDDDDDGFFNSVAISVGGNGGSAFSSGQAMVDSTGAIHTAAHDAIGIVAQSIAGGGGIVKTLATDLESAGGSASAKGTDHTVKFSFSGANGANVGWGYGSGYVGVTTGTGGTIATKGDNSYGILAQSISGGGGLQQGGRVAGSTVADFFGVHGNRNVQGTVIDDGTNDRTNWGANSGLYVTVGDAVTTGGQGAIGIVAQSIGGGGGLAGDTGATVSGYSQNPAVSTAFLAFSGGQANQFTGDGGHVEIDVQQAATVSTSGLNAPAIFAQSIGGGGGRVTNENGAYFGTVGGKGMGGNVAVNIEGAVVATGQGAAGIIAQSDGGEAISTDISSHARQTPGNVSVTIAATGSITVGQPNVNVPTQPNGASAAIYIAGGTKNPGAGTPVNPNVVTNNGTVETYGSEINAVAVYSTGGYTAVTNNGTMSGDVLLTNGGGSGCFTNNGHFNAGNAVTVGACGVTNTGTIELGRTAEAADLAIAGNYKGTGKLAIDADFAAGKADRLVIDGDAHVGDTFEIRPSVLHQGSVELARVQGDLVVHKEAVARSTALFRYDLAAKAGSLTVTPQARFAQAAAGLGVNRQAVANHLQTLWDGGVSFSRGFTALAATAEEHVPATLDTLSGQALGLIGATRYQASLGFIDTVWSGCAGEALQRDGRCVWGKYLGSTGKMDASSDALGYEINSNALRFGAGLAISDTLTIGGAFGYEDLSAEDRNGADDINGDGVQFAGYATWRSGGWLLGGAGEFGYGRFDTRRAIAFDGYHAIATGSAESWHAGLHGRAAWRGEMGWGWFEPRLDLSVIHVSTGGFTEEGGSPFNLAVDSTSDTMLIATPTLAVGTALALDDDATVKLFGSLGYAVMSDDGWSPRARFASGPGSFIADTPLPDRLLKVAVGAELVTTHNVSISATYRGDFGEGYDNQTAELRLGIGF